MSPAGVAYFGNRILRHVAADMDDLAARGFTGVLHTMSENDLAYYRDTLGRMVELSHRSGLSVQVGPWGLGRTFGGEAESLFVANHPEVGQVLDNGRAVAAGCLNADAYRAFVRSWAAAAVETGAEWIFWDEPHWAHPAHFDEPLQRWGCRCDRCRGRFFDETGADMPFTLTPEVAAFREGCLVEFLGELTGFVAGLGGRSTVCLLPHTSGSLGVGDWSAVARLPGVATLATDPYWQAFNEPVVPFVTEYSQRVAGAAAGAGIGAQIWIQGFRLGPEDGDDIHAAVAAARSADVDDLWTWGYEACGHMSYLDTREPDQVWEVLSAALTGGSPPAPTPPPAPARLCAESRGIRGFSPTDAEGDGLGGLVTEQVRPELADLDLRPTVELVRLMADEDAIVAAAVRAAADEIAAAVDAIAGRLAGPHAGGPSAALDPIAPDPMTREVAIGGSPGGRLVYVGAGTAGRMGVLDAAECGPTFNAADRVVALLAGGPDAVTKPEEGAEDDAATGAAELGALGVGPADAVVGISASGRTPYVLGALAAAREVGALTVGLSCHPDSLVSGAAEFAVEVVVGPEVIAGSTRLKAGAAQKLVLNTISTVVMVRLGRTFGNLMVDVSAGSAKLVDRARRIVVTATGATPDEASAALAAADGEVKTAIVALLAGVDSAAARDRLARAGGAVRLALSIPG